ncbi:hypothetical protein ABN057_16120 [Providencia alcalifaciens]|uniref:hypothetical protein n=1 Tax=Providencia TaxID=586 RepID=UPI0019823A5B|nr:hypothetical protein [Providencia rettgeri]ELR5280243.1 hypothetical protein [Providencia rettgeri]MBN6351784.1 hypothetical protein [Providencia rettgeri]UYV41648.1 hypothetical protein NTP67_21180 [Providencia rettgeri]HEM6923972.1 hypothetical protein [Providencia rettgeri]
MNKFFGAIAVTTCLAITGCASTSDPVVYDSSHSRAYNIAQAGGLYDVKDKIVPRADYESLSFAGDAAANTLLFTSSAGLGMSLSEGIGIGLLTAALENPEPAQRNSIVAWMPKSEAESPAQAQKLLLNQVTKAVSETLDELGVGYEKTSATDDEITEFYFYSDELGCPKYEQGMTNRDLCYIRAQIIEPYIHASPDFVDSSTQAYTFISNHKYRYHRFKVTPGKTAALPLEQIYASVSKKLPEWAYLYIASGNLQFGEQKVTAPYLLEQGQPHLFITQDDS